MLHVSSAPSLCMGLCSQTPLQSFSIVRLATLHTHKKWKSNKPWFPGGFPGLVIGGATQKLINLRLHCQLEQKLSRLRGAKEVLCISRLSVEIICCSGQTSSLVPPHLPACSTSRALQLLIGNSDEQNRARSDTTEEKKGGNGPLSGM